MIQSGIPDKLSPKFGNEKYKSTQIFFSQWITMIQPDNFQKWFLNPSYQKYDSISSSLKCILRCLAQVIYKKADLRETYHIYMHQAEMMALGTYKNPKQLHANFVLGSDQNNFCLVAVFKITTYYYMHWSVSHFFCTMWSPTSFLHSSWKQKVSVVVTCT